MWRLRLVRSLAGQAHSPFLGRLCTPAVDDRRDRAWLASVASRSVMYSGSWAAPGSTHCPDFCLTALFAISAVFKELEPDKKVAALFVTVDPERDTPDVLK